MGFKAKIYKAGINPCVEVPQSVTARMKPLKGYITVTGTINGHAFNQTLVPVRNSPYRLYVNTSMLMAGNATVGDIATFTLKQTVRKKKDYSMHPMLLRELRSNHLTSEFNALTQSRQKDILKYLASLKKVETLVKNINRVIGQLKKAKPGARNLG